MLRTRDYNAASLAQPTDFRSMLKSGSILFGTQSRIPSEGAARFVATLPHHFRFIDGEHCPLNPTLLTSLIKTIQFTSAGSMVPFVRLPPSSPTDPTTIPPVLTHILTAGAGGVVLPHVQTAEQARALVRATRFPLQGDRSYPPLPLFGAQLAPTNGRSIYDTWERHVAVVCQIEDPLGIDNVREICAVEGVDALMVGTSDLRLSMGLQVGSYDGEEPEFVEALERVQKAADGAGKPVIGFANSRDVLRKRLQLGWRAVVVHMDAEGIWGSGVRSWEEGVGVVGDVRREGKARL